MVLGCFSIIGLMLDPLECLWINLVDVGFIQIHIQVIWFISTPICLGDYDKLYVVQ